MFRFLAITAIIYLILVMVAHKAPWLLRWIGKLPGDIRVKKKRNVLYLPFSSMLLLSLGITLLIMLLRHLF